MPARLRTQAEAPGDRMRGVLIAAPGSGHGKTTVTLGLLRALRDRGVAVVSGKSGPDYIDPTFHAAATGRPCVTLDAWALDADALRGRAHQIADFAGVIIVEGAMGAFDGAVTGRGPGRGSAAELAAGLGVPMVLVVDASHMAQTAGAVVQGIKIWADEAGTTLAGVILNRVGSERHEAMLRSAITPVCTVLGSIPRDNELTVPSRHLGLLQARELPALEVLISRAAELVATHCDLTAIESAAHCIDAGAPRPIPPLGQRIAVADDEAFAFAYWHMLQDWRGQGAEISVFSPLADEAPGLDADAVFLPGGYPELHAGPLAAASVFRTGLQAAARRGALIYGECGGYMALGDGLVDADGVRHPMLGLLRLETSFAERKRHLGYRDLEISAGPWRGPSKGHEFHYATTLTAEGVAFAEARDAAGQTLGPVGLRDGNVMGSFAHVIEIEPRRV